MKVSFYKALSLVAMAAYLGPDQVSAVNLASQSATSTWALPDSTTTPAEDAEPAAPKVDPAEEARKKKEAEEAAAKKKREEEESKARVEAAIQLKMKQAEEAEKALEAKKTKEIYDKLMPEVKKLIPKMVADAINAAAKKEITK